MPKNLIIHLGDCKSGSTSIQTILFRQAWSSQNHTIVYPNGFNHIKLAKCLYQRDTLRAQPKIYKKIRESILKSDASTAILSGEAFEYVDPQLVENAINTYLPEFKNNVRLISYFRPHAARLLTTHAAHLLTTLGCSPCGRRCGAGVTPGAAIVRALARGARRAARP